MTDWYSIAKKHSESTNTVEPPPTAPASTVGSGDWYDIARQSKESSVQEPVVDKPGHNMGLWVNPRLKEGIKNFPKDLAGEVGGAVQAIAKLPETATTMGEMVAGAAKILFPNSNIDDSKFKAVVSDYKQKYGSVEGYKDYWTKNPAQAMTDLASVFSISGSAAKVGGRMGRLATGELDTWRKAMGRDLESPRIKAIEDGFSNIEKVGDVGQKVGASIDPVNMTRNAVGQAGRAAANLPGVNKIPNRFMQSAVKFSTVLGQAERERFAETMLKHDLSPSVNDFYVIDGKIRDYNNQVDDLIDTAVATGKKMPSGELFKYFSEIRKEAAETGFGNLESITAMARRLHKNINKTAKLREMNPRQVQEFKKGVYRDLESDYKKLMESPVSTKFQMSAAKAAKEWLEDNIDGIKELNTKNKDLIELKKEINKAAGRIMNSDVASFGGAVRGTAGFTVAEALTESKGIATTVGIVVGLLDRPPVKAKIANLVNKLQKKGVKVSPNSTAVRLGLVQLERPSEDGIAEYYKNNWGVSPEKAGDITQKLLRYRK